MWPGYKYAQDNFVFAPDCFVRELAFH